MKNKHLAQWLQEHTQMLGTIDNEQDKVFYEALYESIIDVTLNGDTGPMMDPVLESAAAHAVAVGRELTDLLWVVQHLHQSVWQRIGLEVDPEPAFGMLSDLEEVFIHVIKITVDAYQQGSKLAHAARASEISRLYTESEQKVMQYAAEVARANRELSRLEQAKTDFISIAAHELKTPLTLIQGYVNILTDLQDVNQQIASLSQGINRGAERMGTIINDMLDLSALDTNQLTLVLDEVDLKQAIELIVTQAASALTERKQTIEVDSMDPAPIIEADGRRLHQVFKHIINNAIKYTPDGGKISVSCRKVEATKNRPVSVEIIIEDTGVGIAPEDRDKIFEKFYRVGNSDRHSTGQTKFMGAGPGLGLAIVQGLVEAHGGSVRAESQGFDIQNYPGSRFMVTLPLKATPRAGIHVQRVGQLAETEITETEPG
jgi:signal transduction histidine kinase